jgi:hypothetical protein
MINVVTKKEKLINRV